MAAGILARGLCVSQAPGIAGGILERCRMSLSGCGMAGVETGLMHAVTHPHIIIIIITSTVKPEVNSKHCLYLLILYVLHKRLFHLFSILANTGYNCSCVIYIWLFPFL